MKLHAGHVLCHWSNGLEQSNREGGSLHMLRSSHYIMWFHCVWSMSGLTILLILVHEKMPKNCMYKSS